MTTLSETLTLGLVLVLLFGSICLYLYTRIQQNEQKLNLVESLLIDLKMTTEIKSYPDLPAPTQQEQMASMPVIIEMGSGSAAGAPADVVPTGIGVVAMPDVAKAAAPTVEDSYKKSIEEALEGVAAAASDSARVKVGANYPSLTLSELKALAKQRGISGASGMKRQQLIEVLQTADRAEENGAPPPMEVPFLGGEIKTGE